MVDVLNNGEFVSTQWKKVKCGDIVKVTTDEAFPCDLVLLHSNTDDRTCHVTTANLDGETNLKQRRVQKEIPLLNSASSLTSFRGSIICDKPNTRLYEFKGKIVTDKKEM
jgi:P-type E1-E2 ATPase